MASIIKPHLLVFVNYVKPLQTAAEARYIYSQFAKLGTLSWWHDYASPAGYRHHGARSMAVYTLDNTRDSDLLELERKTLTDDLMSIVGLPTMHDWDLLESGKAKRIEPNYSFLDITPTPHSLTKRKMPEFIPKPHHVIVKSATKYEPFFIATTRQQDVGYMSKYVNMKASDSIPIKIHLANTEK